MSRAVGNGRYVLGALLGVGGMGAVYQAEDLARTESVAVKVLHASHKLPNVPGHMDQEIRAGKIVHHPNVIGVLDGGREDNCAFIVMELVCGNTLRGYVTEQRPSIQRIVAIIEQILAGVDAIHRAGILHGDLKTDNVLISYECEGCLRVKIVDFGLACDREIPTWESHSESFIAGTPEYIAPEIAMGDRKTIASDLYAVGVIFYELLTNSTPFAGMSAWEILRRQINSEVKPPTVQAPELNLSFALERVVLRALEKRPADRFADALEFMTALRSAMRPSHEEESSQNHLEDRARSRGCKSRNKVGATFGRTTSWSRPTIVDTSPMSLPCGESCIRQRVHRHARAAAGIAHAESGSTITFPAIYRPIGTRRTGARALGPASVSAGWNLSTLMQ